MSDAERYRYDPNGTAYSDGRRDAQRDAHARRLRDRAIMCRAVAAMPTNGGHETDRLLREMADRLDREADELEAPRK